MEPRPVGRIERMFAIVDAVHPLNAVVALRIAPPPPAAAVRAALAGLQQRHPALRARIRNGHFVYDVKEPLPYREKSPDTGGWPREVELALNTRIDSGAGPLLRCTALRPDDDGGLTLVLACHHAIVDASSLEALMCELLLRIAGEPAPGGEAAVLPDIERRFPPAYRGARKGLSLTGFTLRQIGGELAARLRRPGLPDFPIPSASDCRTFHFSLDPGQTENLVRAVRRSEITLNTALNAAPAMAVTRSLFAGAAQRVRMVTFADLRPYLDPPLGKEPLGPAISMLRIDALHREGDTLLSMAERAHPSFTRALRRGDKFGAYLLSDRLARLLVRFERFRLGTSAMSYTGPVDLPLEVGGYRLEAVHAFISNNRFGPVLTAQARLFRDRLWVDGLYLDAELSAEQARALIDELKALLTRL